jgi:hypothetical protein
VPARKLESSSKTFTYGLNTYTVDYNKAEVKGTPAGDVPVRVKGTRSGTTLQAQKVSFPGTGGNHSPAASASNSRAW